MAQRAGFAKHNLWATPYEATEVGASGDNVPMSSGRDAGLPAWTQQDRSLVDCDLVTWHTFGVTHIPRPEDWPVMPVEYAKFMMIPNGFFDKTPVLDLPVNVSEQCHKSRL